MIPNDLYIWKLTCRCVFLNKQEDLSRFFGKSNIFKYFSTCQTRSNDFWIMNAMCMFMYLFVVYFSFAPVISASIHRYVNYSDIQVLMMVTETETLASTLHLNKFTYLDYVFLLPYTVGFWSIFTFIDCVMNDLILIGYVSMQKYFFNIKEHKENEGVSDGIEANVLDFEGVQTPVVLLHIQTNHIYQPLR